MKKAKILLGYTTTCPDVYLRYYERDMTLHVESDASYLVLPKAIFLIVGYFFFKTKTDTLNAPINI